MLARAQAERGVAITHNALEVDPWRLTVMNGTLDLRTGEMGEHRREDLYTRFVPVEYDPVAECREWLVFLNRVLNGNEELIAFLQRAMGYSLTGSTGEQCLFFLHGSGANGKSTFLEILRALLGDYAVQADFATFLENRNDGPRNDIARLFGARVVTSSEVGEGKKVNESLVKSLTGTDRVAARFLYAEAFEFLPTFKLWLAANHKPVIRGTDTAIWRRIRLVPFTVEIPEGERDPELPNRLRAELPGILAWAVQGCLLWLESGLGVPDQVRAATDAYRRESDILGAFNRRKAVPR
jgi:putative DNA primase/helicase